MKKKTDSDIRDPFMLTSEGEVSFFYVPFLENAAPVRAVFATRLGGVSEGEYSSMNFSFSRNDSPESVNENYTRFLSAVSLPRESACMSRQVHGTDMLCVQDNESMRALFDNGVSSTADALMTDSAGYTLIKHSADCATVYLLDRAHHAIALLHSGWRGTLQNIAARSVAAMNQRYGTKAEELLCAVAPSIQKCCFEVGDDVAEAFSHRFGEHVDIERIGMKMHIDIPALIREQLMQCGVPGSGIAVSGLCSYCEDTLLHSHRRTQGHCGLLIGAFALL